MSGLICKQKGVGPGGVAMPGFSGGDSLLKEKNNNK